MEKYELSCFWQPETAGDKLKTMSWDEVQSRQSEPTAGSKRSFILMQKLQKWLHSFIKSSITHEHQINIWNVFLLKRLKKFQNGKRTKEMCTVKSFQPLRWPQDQLQTSCPPFTFFSCTTFYPWWLQHQLRGSVVGIHLQSRPDLETVNV